MNLQDLIRGSRDVTGFIQDEALRAAFDKQQAEVQERVTAGLVSLFENFSNVASCAAREAETARKAAETAELRLQEIKAALDYFGATRNPLPLFRVSGHTEAGVNWLHENGLEVPSVRDKNSAWYIQTTDAATEAAE